MRFVGDTRLIGAPFISRLDHKYTALLAASYLSGAPYNVSNDCFSACPKLRSVSFACAFVTGIPRRDQLAGMPAVVVSVVRLAVDLQTDLAMTSPIVVIVWQRLAI
jgi:hypothetical protein